MDKKTIAALGMMMVVVLAWVTYQSFTERPIPKEMKQGKTEQVAQKTKTEKLDSDTKEQEFHAQADDSLAIAYKYGKFFSKHATGSQSVVNIETDLFKARISSKGGSILRWELKNYKKWDKVPSQLIRPNRSELFMEFRTIDNKKIDTRDLYFELNNNSQSISLTGEQKITLTARLEVEAGKVITKTLTFHGNKYHLDQDIILENLTSVIPNRGYDLKWGHGLHYQEENSVDESSDALAMTVMNGEIEELDAADADPVESTATGLIDYAAIKTKYFGVAIIPQPWQEFDGTVDLGGHRKHIKDQGVLEYYSIGIRVPYNGGVQKNSYKVYLGPLEYDELKQYGLTDMVNFGMRFGIRQIGEFIMMPFLSLIHQFIPNFGIALILFSIIIKLVLYPLSVKQMRSSQKMQLLAPEMEKIREQFKDDQTQQQQETMKLYSQYGINPAGGCLPLLAQMPILFSLYQLLRSAIDLRQADFFLWIHDLSVPDVIIDFGFKLPLIGLDKFSGLAILMGITMFIQQKMTISDPRQKNMMYMMPVMMTLMFSNFPAGLNLYYFVFNLIGIAQQVYINKFSKNKPTLSDLKAAPKKEGWLQKKMREAQQMADAQGKGAPGKSGFGQNVGKIQNAQKKPKKNKNFPNRKK